MNGNISDTQSVVQPASSLLPSALDIYLAYNRQHRLRLAANISRFLMLALALVIIAGTVLYIVRGVFVTNLLRSTLFIGVGLALCAALWLGNWLSRREQMLWATGIVTSVSVIGTCLLSLFANYLILTAHINTQVGFLSLMIGILVAGYLGTIRWVIGTVIVLNVYSIVAMFVILPYALRQPPVESIPLALIIIIMQWMIAALMIIGQVNYQQTIRDLRDAELAYARAQQLDELKDQFISSVNHELRNPLMAMMNYVTILRQRNESMTTERRAQALESLEGTGKRVVQLVGSILDVRQMAEHRGEFTSTLVPVKTTLMTASTLLDPAEARLDERELRVEIPDQLEIWGNETYLQQILTNLLSNAVKYSKKNTPITVQARLVRETRGGDSRPIHARTMVEIVVSDQGLGIPPAQIPLLFNRFVRLPRDLTSRTTGNGLGLYLCKVLAEAMGGSIWVESSGVAGEGSAFHVRLPQEQTYPVDDALTVTQKRGAITVTPFTPARTRLAIAAILLCLIGGLLIVRNHNSTPTSLPVASHPTASGIAHFVNANGDHSNSVALSIAGLTAPAKGSHYQAWLIDSANEQILPLGSLTSQGQAYTLAYHDDAQNANLLELGDKLEVTQEQGSNTVPLGKVVLSGIFPPKAFVHIRHLLASFPATPANKGLLIGLVEQAQLLDQQAHQLQSIGQENPQLARCLTLSMIGIVEGTHGQHYQALPKVCAGLHVVSGDGYGLLPSPTATAPGGGYLDGTSTHLALALQQTDATAYMHDLGVTVIASIATLKSWAATLDSALVESAQTTSAAQVTTLVTLADDIYAGGAPASQTLAAPTTTAGALYAYAEGQLIADLPLR